MLIKKPSLILLTLYISIAAIGAMLITPALPAIAITFAVTQGVAEWVISIYILGYGLGQLIHSPLSNRYGRKKILAYGMLVGLLSTLIGLLAIYAHLFMLFLLSRFFAAIGLSAGLVLSMAMIKDSYDEASARKAFSIVVMNFAFVPFIAIAAGGILSTHFDWISTQYVFLFLIVIFILFSSKLPETHLVENRTQLSFVETFKNYLQLFTHKDYLVLMLIYCMAASISYLFNGLAPIIGIKALHMTPQNYSFYSILTSCGFILGAISSNKLAHRYSARTLILSGLLITLGANIVTLILFSAHAINILTLFLPAMLGFCGASLVTPNASMRALSMIKDHASGAAILNTSALVVTSFLLTVAGHFIEKNPIALPISIILVVSTGLLILASAKK
ncbi:MAG: MFS transporter [Gammaproteobacteria bacterium]|nr:MFS transporter [Gammaproteobacteria bacterium]